MTKKEHFKKAEALEYAALDQDMFTQPTTRQRAHMHRALACEHAWHEGSVVNGYRVRDCQRCGLSESIRN